MEKDENQTGYTLENGNMGQVQIADEVVAIIAGLAATEVEGVASMAGNITNELVSKLGKKSLSKGIRVKVEDGIVNVNVALNIAYGYSVPKTCKKVQEKVKAAIENMTGLEVEKVDIQIAKCKHIKRKIKQLKSSVKVRSQGVLKLRMVIGFFTFSFKDSGGKSD